MVSKNIKYTIFERYPSILITTIPITDIIIGIGYYIWIFIYFFKEFFYFLFTKGPLGVKPYIGKFFKKDDAYKGMPTEVDYDIDIDKKLDLRSITEDTDKTTVKIYRGKKAFIKLKEVIKENDLYEHIDKLPITYFTLKEETMIGSYDKERVLLTRGYSNQVMIYIEFINKLKSYSFKKNKKK